MLHLFGMLGGACLVLIGVMIVLGIIRGTTWHDGRATCVVATGLAAYGMFLIAAGIWLITWAAGFA